MKQKVNINPVTEHHVACDVCHRTMLKGERAGENPWEATTLEWNTSSPPPHDNFAGVLPVVHHGPYEFAVPGAPRDYVMQTDVDVEVPSGNGHNGKH